MISSSAYDTLPQQLPENEHVVTQDQYNSSKYASYQGGAVVIDYTAQNALAKANKVAEITQACAAEIVGGFTSTALGATHTYPSDMTDQANLAASVLSSLYPNLDSDWSTPYVCADITGVWNYQDHTAAEIQQVGIDAKNAILTALAKKTYLVAQIGSLIDANAIAAVTWTSK